MTNKEAITHVETLKTVIQETKYGGKLIDMALDVAIKAMNEKMEGSLIQDFTINEIKLRDCPFCGGKSELIKVSNRVKNESHIADAYKVMCLSCKIETSYFYSDIYQDDNGNLIIEENGALNAISAWNKRYD